MGCGSVGFQHGSVSAVKTHEHLCRLTISADSESPKLGWGVSSPTSPCASHNTDSPVCMRSLVAGNLGGVRRLMHWPVWTIYLPNAMTLADVCLLCTKLVPLLDVCRPYFFAASSTRNPYSIVSGLLVTGRAGAGKTSVVQATAKALEWDSGVQACKPSANTFRRSSYDVFVVTLYIDVSRYTEKPVQTLRTQFQFWLDKAMWHRPSVLVFDNLEKLLGAELEVYGYFCSYPSMLTYNG